jgi:hypothetical protein
VDVEAIVVERPAFPSGLVPIGGLAGRALLTRDVRIDVAGPAGTGELWSASWRWWEHRPRLAFAVALPSPGALPGTTRLDLSWERQTYATPLADVGASVLMEQDRRRAAVGFSDWWTGRVRWQLEGALDRWGERRHVSAGGTVDVRLARDRISLGAGGAAWMPTADGRRFGSGGVTSAWRSAPAAAGPRWIALAGFTSASLQAPLDVWPGAGTGHAREPLLRAHPLLRDGVVQGPVFGRRLAQASLEYQHPLWTSPAGRWRMAGFADTARAWQRTDGTASPLHVDAGMGVRWRAPGLGGTARVDVARGMRDGRMAVSAGWVAREW